MNHTADQLFEKYGKALVTIVTTYGDKYVARLIAVVGGVQIASKETFPESKFLEIDHFVDEEPFARQGRTYDFERETVHPYRIADIRPYNHGAY